MDNIRIDLQNKNLFNWDEKANKNKNKRKGEKAKRKDKERMQTNHHHHHIFGLYSYTKFLLFKHGAPRLITRNENKEKILLKVEATTYKREKRKIAKTIRKWIYKLPITANHTIKK